MGLLNEIKQKLKHFDIVVHSLWCSKASSTNGPASLPAVHNAPSNAPARNMTALNAPAHNGLPASDVHNNAPRHNTPALHEIHTTMHSIAQGPLSAAAIKSHLTAVGKPLQWACQSGLVLDT